MIRGDGRRDAEARQAPAARDEADNPLERLQLLAGDDDAIASFLDELEIRGPRDREMLTELARSSPLAAPDRFPQAHRQAATALETLSRHGYHGSTAGRKLGPARAVVRFLVELVARYVVISYLRNVATAMRNLYWLREIESARGAAEWLLLRPARRDAQALEIVFKRREIGLPTFLVGGILVPVGISIGRLSSGTLRSWWTAALVGLLGALIVVGISWVVLRGAAMASRRIRLATELPLETLWSAIGNCGEPPRDQSRKLASIAIVLSVAAWIVLPLAVAIALVT